MLAIDNLVEKLGLVSVLIVLIKVVVVFVIGLVVTMFMVWFERKIIAKAGEGDAAAAGYLKQRGIKTVFVTGLATDFCVAWSIRCSTSTPNG